MDARTPAANLLRNRVAHLIESGLRGLKRVAALEEREELALLRVLVVEDENAAHPFGRRHLARRHALVHELVELLRVPALERGHPYPHGETSWSMATTGQPTACRRPGLGEILDMQWPPLTSA